MVSRTLPTTSKSNQLSTNPRELGLKEVQEYGVGICPVVPNKLQANLSAANPYYPAVGSKNG